MDDNAKGENMKFSYGGFEADPPDYPDAWVRLNTVAEYLEDGEALPPHLAMWLGRSIRDAAGNSKRLLVALGLANRRGGQTIEKNGWLTLGQDVCELEDEGLMPEAALAAVLSKVDESVSRSTLQRWRDTYRRAEEEARSVE